MSDHTDTNSHIEVVIVEDEDHMAHVWSDVRMGYYEEERGQEEADNLSNGTWTAYGVTTARVCDCCDSVIEKYVTALWGCVVETSNQTGRYAVTELARIEDEHLREIAAELVEEAKSVPA